MRIPNVDTLASLIDRLAIECHKTGYFENKKREEQKSPTPDLKKIQEWDHLSREACELRAALKRKIDELFEEVMGGKYKYLKEPRTFSPAQGSRFSELLDERYCFIGDLAAKGELIKSLEKELAH